jgi:hypothetical protein
VQSSEPDRSVNVTAPDGATASWHTDSSGYADVFLHDRASAAGERITVRVGGATCHATL